MGFVERLQTTLTSGHFLELFDHPRTEWNDLWLLTQLSHEGKHYAEYQKMMMQKGDKRKIPKRVELRIKSCLAGTMMDGPCNTAVIGVDVILHFHPVEILKKSWLTRTI